jgi:hypothetical protein
MGPHGNFRWTQVDEASCPLGDIDLQDFLVEDELISLVGDHLAGALAEPKARILTRPFSCWQPCVLSPLGGSLRPRHLSRGIFRILYVRQHQTFWRFLSQSQDVRIKDPLNVQKNRPTGNNSSRACLRSRYARVRPPRRKLKPESPTYRWTTSGGLQHSEAHPPAGPGTS